MLVPKLLQPAVTPLEPLELHSGLRRAVTGNRVKEHIRTRLAARRSCAEDIGLFGRVNGRRVAFD